jgi:hypothetical protein
VPPNVAVLGLQEGKENSDPASVAEKYGRFPWELWNEDRFNSLPDRENFLRSRFAVGLSTDGRGALSFTQLTKRAVLVSDTLLLTHDRTVRSHDIGAEYPKEKANLDAELVTTPIGPAFAGSYDFVNLGKVMEIPERAGSFTSGHFSRRAWRGTGLPTR